MINTMYFLFSQSTIMNVACLDSFNFLDIDIYLDGNILMGGLLSRFHLNNDN